MKTSSVAQLVLNLILQCRPGRFFDEAKLRLLMKARYWLIRHGDPLVSYSLGGWTMLLPISHSLPITLKRLPNYSRNVARIAKYIGEKYPNLTIIDIGANVGDTAALLREVTSRPILCIEGNSRYFSILSVNIATNGSQAVEAENSFVGTVTGEVKGEIWAQKGTASLRLYESATHTVALKTLSDIIHAHPNFASPKLVKIDTDGMDSTIILGNLALWQTFKPVLFCEYQPDSISQASKADARQVLSGLRGVGYVSALVFEETGEFAFSVDLQNDTLLEDLFFFYAGRKDKRYSDIAIFHADDRELHDSIRTAEHEFFSRFRK